MTQAYVGLRLNDAIVGAVSTPQSSEGVVGFEGGKKA